MRFLVLTIALELAACGAPQPRILVSVEAATSSGTTPDTIELELSFDAWRDTNPDIGQQDIEPVSADCDVFADGVPVIQKRDLDQWTASFVGYPHVLELVIKERAGAEHRAPARLPEPFGTSIMPEQPVSGSARVDWSPSGDDGVSVTLELVHRDDGLSSWVSGSVDDGSELLEVLGPLNSLDVTRSKSESIDGIQLSESLLVTKRVRAEAVPGQSCDSDDDCAPLECDWATSQCRAPAEIGSPCRFDDQCAAGSCNWETQLCSAPAPAGSACLRDVECASELCLWEQRICGAPLPAGQACVRDRECTSGVCSAFVCM